MLAPREVRSVADAKKIVDERELTHVKVGVFDIDGILRGKYMSREKFFGARQGFGFCDVVLGWDWNDQLYDNVKFTGWHTGYPDAPVRILPDTCRDAAVRRAGPVLPRRVHGSRRNRLSARRAAARARARRARWASRCTRASSTKFFVFDETPESVREKGYATSSRWRRDSSATR